MDAAHTQEKEAIEDGLSRVANYRGISLGKPRVTTSGNFVTHDDGSVTGMNFDCAWDISDQLKAIIDAHLDGQGGGTGGGDPPPPDDRPPEDSTTGTQLSTGAAIDQVPPEPAG